MQDTLAKKIFAVGSAVAMTVALGLPFAAQAAAHGVGTNVLTSDGTVWMITSAGRRAYTSGGAFLSYGFNSFATVVAASPEDLNLPADPAGFIPPQDGTVFCATATKGSDVQGECSLVTTSQKAAFTSQPVFAGLGFSFTNAQYGDSSFLTKTQNIDNTTAAHRPGVLVNNNGTVQLVGTTGLLGIPDLATFNSWGYSFAKVVPANAADKAMIQTGVMAMRQTGQLSPTALATVIPCTGSSCPTPVQTGSLTASLSTDTPAAGTLVSSSVNTTPGQTGADLAHFTFTGSGTVTQVVINRIGVSADTSINNVYLYMGNNRITDAGSFSTGMVTFTNSAGLFTVNGSAEISVRVDVAGNISGQTVGAQLTSFSIASGAAQATSISGNLFTIAQVNNLATASVPNATSITSSGANNGGTGTINAGTANAILWSAPVTISQRNVLFKYVAFKQIGSISQDAIQNLKLMVDGTAVGSPASISNSGGNSNVVIFDMFANPVTLQSGTHTIELHGDIIKGSSFNYNFSIQTAADAVFFDTNYNVNIPFTLASGAQVVQLSPGTTTINAGVISIQQDVLFTATQFVANQSQTILGQWTMKAFGENVKVQNLQVSLTYTGTPTASEGFNNLSLFVNGGAVGSTVSALGPNNTYTFGSSNLFTVPAGTTVTLQVKGDSVLNTPTAVTAVRADLITPQNALQGVTSFALSPTGGSITYTGRTLTTGNSNAVTAINSQFTNTNLTTNMLNQKIGSYVIQAGSIDGVRVSSLTVGFPAGSNNTFPLNSLANLYIVTPAGNATPVSPNTSNNFSVNFTVAANQTATVDVFADVGNNTGGTVNNVNVPTLTAVTTTPGSNAGSPSTAAFGTVTITGATTTGGTLTTTINGTPTTVTITAGDATSTVATNLANAITVNNSINGTVTAVASTTATNVVTITARTAGTVGNFSLTSAVVGGTYVSTASAVTSGTNGTVAVAQISTLTVGASVVIGNVYTATINGTTVTYTSTAGTQNDVTAGLTAAINANATIFAAVHAVNTGGGVVTLTSQVPGATGFTVSSSAAAGSQLSVGTGNLQTSLIGSGSGATSNQSILLNSNGLTTGTAVLGQVMSVGTGSLSSVSLTGSSPTSSFVLGGTTNQPAATYTFHVNAAGGVTITELGFNIAASSTPGNTISLVTVGGSSGQVVNGKALVTGLNIVVPVGNAGLDVPVTVNYANVGSPSTVVDQISQLVLAHIKLLAGNTTTSLSPSSGPAFSTGDTLSAILNATGTPANTMFLAGTVPTVSLTASNSTLISGSDIVGSIVVSATGGRLDIRRLPVNITASGNTTISGGVVTLIDHATGKAVAIASGNTGVVTNGGNPNTLNIVLAGTDGLDQVTGGSTRTYDVQVSGVTATGASGTSSLVLSLGAATGFTFNDINGGTNGVAGAIGGNTFIVNYPTNSVSIRN